MSQKVLGLRRSSSTDLKKASVEKFVKVKGEGFTEAARFS